MCVSVPLSITGVQKKSFNPTSQSHHPNKQITDGLHPGAKAYQEWGTILANRIDVNFSRSTGVAGVCRPGSPHETPAPPPVR